MLRVEIKVYCLGPCSTRDPARNAASALCHGLAQLAERVVCYSWEKEPMAFQHSPLVRETLAREGVSALPLVMAGDLVISKRAPNFVQIAQAVRRLTSG